KARFVCVTTLAQDGRAIAVLSDSVEGVIAKAPRGSDGFGYDPVFFFPQLGRTYAEITREEKNQYSHRGRAFRKAIAYLEGRVLESPFSSLGNQIACSETRGCGRMSCLPAEVTSWQLPKSRRIFFQTYFREWRMLARKPMR